MSLGPAPQRLGVPVELARRLVDTQFPQWSGLPIRPVANGGWDNLTFHLGPSMSLRLPSAAEYAQAVAKEHRWLPVFAPLLPRPISVPLALGAPGEGYPFPWSVYRWLPGTPARAADIADPIRFALDLASFLSALQSVDPASGPEPGTHNWFRGGPLRVFDGLASDALASLDGVIDVGRAREIWKQAMEVPWDGQVRWFHGDVASGNILLLNGELGAVIDFGTCGVGDRACDYAVAWTLLTAAGREAFRDRLAIDEDSWLRGRGWALWKGLSNCANSLDESGRPSAETLHVLNEIFAY
ncbi:aminoglycoside phosphotransferase family protein [Paractinoplanes lichenicola]|uniref:Aminoglycoside phosphotransferase family protein n=1 Tax=Paractinoplanes lichenicola TaxID=2802976 RepID=A0ABS1VPQ9_9ACTN|nr:aminoglycoside phosphotransferase family protein [Actinoplanes lichenicola]MBL7256609.1 aminoglycoside phosphotransferase family protein [Actinoplanes lichenicola]